MLVALVEPTCFSVMAGRNVLTSQAKPSHNVVRGGCRLATAGYQVDAPRGLIPSCWVPVTAMRHELGSDHCLDEIADPIAQARFDRIEQSSKR